jgi:diguanylate cyclase (GGDEF)-like protein
VRRSARVGDRFRAPGWSGRVRALRHAPPAAFALGYLVLYLAGAWWGRELSHGSATTPWYPPPGLTVALVVCLGLRFAPLAALAELIGSIVVFDVAGAFSAFQIVLNALVIAVAYSFGPGLLRYVTGNGPGLRRPSSQWLFVVTCVLLGPLMAALGGVAIREWADAMDGQQFGTAVRTWFLGDALGVVTIAPLALILMLERLDPRALLRRSSVLEAIALFGTAAAAVLLDGAGTPRFAYLCLLPLAWIAHRHGLIGATLAACSLNLFIVILADLTLRPQQLEDFQGLLIVISLAALILGSTVSHGQRALRRATNTRGSDPVTGLASRSRLLGWLDERLRADGGGGAVLMLVDIDRFSIVNDIRGHSAGDRLLRLIAERLAEVVRFEGRCARFGSDELAVLLASGDTAAAYELAHRITSAVAEPFTLDGEPISIRAHAGIAAATESDAAGDVIRGACLALQRAAEDRRQIVVLDSALREQGHDSHVLESDLPRAIDAGQLYLVYQPITWLGRDRTETYEALLRWDHPTYGGVPPQVTVELAQRAGLLARVSELVLGQACAQVAAWTAAGRRVVVEVNIAPADLLYPEFAERSADIVRAAGVDPSQITFELTEESAIDDLEHARSVMASLRGQGFALAIDDFGTGYASLTYLESLPADMLKLDRRFVASLTHASRSEAILRAIVPLAHALGLTVVAEGVEHQHQLDLLEGIGCDAIQGFLLGVPRPAAEWQLARA